MATIERKTSGSSVTDEKSFAAHDIVNEKGPQDHHHLPTLPGPALVDAADVGDVSYDVFLHCSS